MKKDISVYAEQYKKELLDNVIPFWDIHSIDKQFGGYFTCLARDGQVFDTDKFMWLQGRQVYIYAMLYNKVEQKKSWLDTALHGADFMQKYGRDANGDWYFSLTQDGKPLTQPFNIFSDCFAAMGFGELYKATKNEEYKTIAVDTFNRIIERQNNPKGSYNKTYPNTRPLKNFALPMILTNLALILEDIIGTDYVNAFMPNLIDDVLNVFYQEDLGLILENVTPDGQFSDCMEGRLVNPGHTLESMWFLMDLGVRLKDDKLIKKSVQIALQAMEYGWDKVHGGILYFLDCKAYPPQQLEWDQKLWWVHIEALIAMAKAYQLTGNEECKAWFLKLQEYTWAHFKDQEYGEWYGYLNREGEVLLPLKGGKWKGCFHVPRGLYQLWRILEE